MIPAAATLVDNSLVSIINPLPTVTAINPTAGPDGGAAFIMTVAGTGFVNGSSTVRWNGTNRVTTFLSSTKLRANILAADVATPGTAAITVFTTAPGGGTSVQTVKYTVGGVSELPTTEYGALVALYNSTLGDSWTVKTGWLDTPTPCSWFGVTCAAGHVSILNLYTNKLTGPIPTQLGNLSKLTDLYLNGNKLSGTIPTQLGSLSNLTSLNLNYNLLTGGIPTQLGSLTKLTNLGLSNNQLTGTIPTQLGSLTKLTYLSFSNNVLTGPMPDSLRYLVDLHDYYFPATVCAPNTVLFSNWLNTITYHSPITVCS